MSTGMAAEVTLEIAAAPGEVFRYLTEPVRYVRWMGSAAVLEAVPGGRYEVSMSDGFRAAGRFESVEAPYRVVFSWGFADDEAASHTKHQVGQAASPTGGMPAGGMPADVVPADVVPADVVPADVVPADVVPADAMPAGSTRVTVTLAWAGAGTRLVLRHDNLPSPELVMAHQVAWETYLPRLATVAAGGDPGPDPHSVD